MGGVQLSNKFCHFSAVRHLFMRHCGSGFCVASLSQPRRTLFIVAALQKRKNASGESCQSCRSHARAESCDNSCFICLIFSRFFFFFFHSSLLAFRFSLLFANKTQFVLWLESPFPYTPTVPINSSPSDLRIMRNRLQA